MLTIRNAQMAVFSRAEIKKFEDRMVIHLKKFFPRQCEALGEAQLRETIQYGIKRAAGYGITSKPDVYKYVDLMVVLGRDFDTDRRFPWASKILRTHNSPVGKMNALRGAAKKHLRRA